MVVTPRPAVNALNAQSPALLATPIFTLDAQLTPTIPFSVFEKNKKGFSVYNLEHRRTGWTRIITLKGRMADGELRNKSQAQWGANHWAIKWMGQFQDTLAHYMYRQYLEFFFDIIILLPELFWHIMSIIWFAEKYILFLNVCVVINLLHFR